MSFNAIKWAMEQTIPCSEKMVLIVLSDFYNDKTHQCNPEKTTIAKVAGVNPRTADRVLIRLKGRGLIDFEPTNGRRSNGYTLQFPQGSTPAQSRGEDKPNPGTESANPGTESANPGTVPPEPIRTSYNLKSGAPSGTQTGKPACCPHQEILKTYHDTLPMLPAVRVMTDTRQRLLRSRWTEDTERQSLDWWEKYFEYVAGSDFLTGRTEGAGDRPPFCADFEWLIRPSNFVKVIEGKYHRQRGAA